MRKCPVLCGTTTSWTSSRRSEDKNSFSGLCLYLFVILFMFYSHSNTHIYFYCLFSAIHQVSETPTGQQETNGWPCRVPRIHSTSGPGLSRQQSCTWVQWRPFWGFPWSCFSTASSIVTSAFKCLKYSTTTQPMTESGDCSVYISPLELQKIAHAYTGLTNALFFRYCEFLHCRVALVLDVNQCICHQSERTLILKGKRKTVKEITPNSQIIIRTYISQACSI